MKNILVTGGAGFIGSNLCEELVNRGFNVFALDDLSSGYEKNIVHLKNEKSFTFIKADIRNYDEIDKIIKENKIELISHQAARGSVPKSIENPLLTNDININGTLNILWAAVQNKVEKVVCAISSSVYGNTPKLPKSEDMGYNPISPYAITKVTTEMYCKIFYEIYGLKTIGLRYFNVYGRRQDPNGNYAAVIPKWIYKALNEEDLPLNGKGDQTRDFTYINDVVNANILALETNNENAFGKGYNIGYGGRVSIKELGETIISLTNSNSKLVHVEERKGDIKDSFADINLAKKNLGYNPKNSIVEGIKLTIDWYKNQNY
jgi:UDP-N-acetylglucosamine 4-epimerase